MQMRTASISWRSLGCTLVCKSEWCSGHPATAERTAAANSSLAATSMSPRDNCDRMSLTWLPISSAIATRSAGAIVAACPASHVCDALRRVERTWARAASGAREKGFSASHGEPEGMC